MVHYVLNEVDPSVEAAYSFIQELGLVQESDRVDRMTYTPEDADTSRRIPLNEVDNFVQRYANIGRDDDLLVVLNGSGDHHHHTYGVCRGIVEQDGEEYTVIHFDHHGDSRVPQGFLDCGNYLGELVKGSELARKGIIIGAGSMVGTDGWNDYNSFWFDPKALEAGLEVYPYTKGTASLYGVSSEPDVDCVDSTFIESCSSFGAEWHTIKDRGIEAIAARAMERTDTEDVYITVDLDVLTAEYATTDWGNGDMSLPELLEAVASIEDARNVVGLDINGTDGEGDERTLYTIAAIVNEVTGGPYDRSFFYERIAACEPE
ncbi:MAG: arginase family protein [Methanopyri archaeon]|nr:arginase family protein [Methanopyri archaeon]